MKFTSVIAAAAVTALGMMSSVASAAPTYMMHNNRAYQMLPTVQSVDINGIQPAIAVGAFSPAYTQTSATGLTFNSGLTPDALDDVGLNPGTAAARPYLTNLGTAFARITANTTTTAAVVFVDFWDIVNPASTGVVESSYLGGFGGTVNVTAGAANSAGAFSFSGLNTLTTPIAFTDDSIGVEISYANAAGTAYSTFLSTVSSIPGVPTLGSSIPGIYRDADANGDFQATDLQATSGNTYLSLSTAAAVPEPMSLSLVGAAGLLAIRRRAR